MERLRYELDGMNQIHIDNVKLMKEEIKSHDKKKDKHIDQLKELFLNQMISNKIVLKGSSKRSSIINRRDISTKIRS